MIHLSARHGLKLAALNIHKYLLLKKKKTINISRTSPSMDSFKNNIAFRKKSLSKSPSKEDTM